MSPSLRESTMTKLRTCFSSIKSPVFKRLLKLERSAFPASMVCASRLFVLLVTGIRAPTLRHDLMTFRNKWKRLIAEVLYIYGHGLRVPVCTASVQQQKWHVSSVCVCVCAVMFSAAVKVFYTSMWSSRSPRRRQRRSAANSTLQLTEDGMLFHVSCQTLWTKIVLYTAVTDSNRKMCREGVKYFKKGRSDIKFNGWTKVLKLKSKLATHKLPTQ